jgi:hypothetical protein
VQLGLDSKWGQELERWQDWKSGQSHC